MTISEAIELLCPEHRKYCISEFKKLPSFTIRISRDYHQDSKKGNDNTDPKYSAALVPICRLADGSASLLYTKRLSLLRCVRII